MGLSRELRVDEWPAREQDQDLLELGWSVRLSTAPRRDEHGTERYYWVYDHPADNYLNGPQNRAMARKMAGLRPAVTGSSDLDFIGRVLTRRDIDFELEPTPNGYALTVSECDFLFDDDFVLKEVNRG